MPARDHAKNPRLTTASSSAIHVHPSVPYSSGAPAVPRIMPTRPKIWRGAFPRARSAVVRKISGNSAETLSTTTTYATSYTATTTRNHTTSPVGLSAGGTHTSANATTSGTMPSPIHGTRRPQRVRRRSEAAPTSGLSTALRMPCATMAPATQPAGTPRWST